MWKDLGQNLDRWARQLAPCCVLFILVLVGVLPFGIPFMPEIMPMLTMIAIFYWTVYRPDLIPPVFIFFIGLIQDVLVGSLLGMNALALLLVYGITLTQRQVFLSKPFSVTWLGFIVISGGAFLMMWCLTGILNINIILNPVILFQFLLTIFLFPLSVWLFVRMHRYVVR